MGTRPERVQEAIRQEISKIIQSELRDPRIGFLTVTKVDLSKDLRYARIYFSVLGEKKDNELALRGLNSAKGYIKGVLFDRIKLRIVPEVVFKIDDTAERTREIFDLLDRIKKEKRDAEGDRGDTKI